MGEIADYSVPQTEGAEPTGGITPNLEAVSTVGRGIQAIGRNFEDAADVLHRREAQKEVSSVYAKVAQARSEWTTKLYQSANDPNFDTEKFQQDYSDYVNKIGDQLNTGEGKDFFTRQAARLGGTLLSLGTKVQSQRDFDRFKAENQTSLDMDTATLKKDPTQFADILDGYQEKIKKEVDLNPSRLGPIQDQIKGHIANQLAKAAILGGTSLDPGSKEDERTGKGQQMLDSGAFDQYLSLQDREVLGRLNDRAAKQSDIQSNYVDKQAEVARKKEYEAWGQQAIEDLRSGKFKMSSLNAVDANGNHILKWEDQERWMNIADQWSKRESRGNNSNYANLIRDIHADEGDPNRINSPNVIADKLKKGEISIPQFDHAMSEYNHSQVETENRTDKKALLNFAASQLRYKDLNSLDGKSWSYGGESDNARFIDALRTRENVYRNKNMPLSDLYQMGGKESFYSQVQRFVSTPDERMRNAPHKNADELDTVNVISPTGQKGTMPKKNWDTIKDKNLGWKLNE